MLNVRQIKSLKGKNKIVVLTAYDCLMASLLEKAGVDIILVGDSAGNVFAGHKNTIPVTVEDMIYHGRSVMRGTKDTFVVIDMPFMSYQASVSDAKRAAGRLIKETGAHAVKVEGGLEIIPQVKAIIGMGLPVMGHIGFQPQSVNKYGGHPVQGVGPKDREELIGNAIALEKAGVFSIVVEMTKKETARELTKSVNVPVIGIGAGRDCDGQVVVTHDMLGLFEDFTPKFVKKYDNLAKRIRTDVSKFAKDVRDGKFPGNKQSF